MNFLPLRQLKRNQAKAQAQYDLLAVDLDGTLLRSDKKMSVVCQEAIFQASEAGVKVVLASARPPRSTREIYDLLKLDTLQVNYNGAMIVDPVAKQVAHHQPLPGELARRIVELARTIEKETIIHLEVEDRWITDRVDPQLSVATSLRFKPDYIGPLEEHLSQPVTKLMILAEPEQLSPVTLALYKQHHPWIDIHITDEHLIQIVCKGVNKATALEQVAGHYNIEQSRVMAIGDAPNDVAMLQWAGLGVAVDNAWKRTRQVADAIVASNDDDGVARAIEQHLLA